jgi:hypothetical protein
MAVHGANSQKACTWREFSAGDGSFLILKPVVMLQHITNYNNFIK